MDAGTQVCLSDEQIRRLGRLAEAEGATMTEIVSRALDAYCDDEYPDPGPALAAAFGVNPDAAAPSRDEWERG